MNRQTALKILNPILGILVITQILSGMLHGTLPYAVFEVVHEGGGFVLTGCIVLHVILNWNWIRNAYFSRASRQVPGAQDGTR